MVLINGTKGIATGFATNILPHDPKSIKSACLEYINTGDIKNRIGLKFPEFNGTVEKDKEEPNKYAVNGVYEKRGKTQLIITEVPYGFDRESYVKVLDGLEEDGDIVSYEDQCDKTGFKFEVKLKQNTSAIWNKSKIINKFKLSKSMTQNLTVIDQNGKLREYEDARQLVKDFCDYRSGILQQRIDLRTKEEQERCRWLNVKMQFIQAVLDSKIEFKNKKKKDVTQQIYEETHALNETDIDKLLRINILSLTDELVKDLAKESKEAQKNLKFWSKEIPKNQFIKDLEEI